MWPSLEDFDTNYEQLTTSLAQLVASARAAGETSRAKDLASLLADVESLEAQHGHFHEDADEMIALVEAGQSVQAQAFLNEEVEMELDQLQDQLDRVEHSLGRAGRREL